MVRMMENDRDEFEIESRRINKIHAENIDAVRASIADFRRGERGTLAGEHSQKLRQEFDIT